MIFHGGFECRLLNSACNFICQKKENSAADLGPCNIQDGDLYDNS